MSSREYDRMLLAQFLREESGCVECGYYRSGAHHPGIKCLQTGRCGQCGNDWPCADHIGLVRSKVKSKKNTKKRGA